MTNQPTALDEFVDRARDSDDMSFVQMEDFSSSDVLGGIVTYECGNTVMGVQFARGPGGLHVEIRAFQATGEQLGVELLPSLEERTIVVHPVLDT